MDLARRPLPSPPARRDGDDALLPAPSAWEAGGCAALAVVLAWSALTSGRLAAVVSGADLVFHEAGHPIFGLLGWRFLTYLGGTLAQLAFPVAAAVTFARSRRTAALVVALVWLGFNLVEVGRYAGDARDRLLPLLAADEDEHDWWNLLGMLGLRERSPGIGLLVSATGWALWTGAPGWLGWRWWRARAGG